MKSKLVICMLILTNVIFPIKCQEIYFDSIYIHLDTTRLSTKILYDKILPLVSTNYTSFTGAVDTISISENEWMQLYLELNCAHLKHRNILDFMSMYDSVTSIIKQGTVPIGVINLKYNTIKDYAFADNLLQESGQYVLDGTNLSENPYNESRCFAACALKDTINNFSVSFCLDENLTFIENNEQIQFYEIDFDDGNGYITLNPNSLHSVEYQFFGKKIINIEAHLSNNSVYYCKTAIYIEEPLYSANLTYSANQYILSSSEPDSIFSINITYQGWPFGGKYGVWYGCNNGLQLKKPIIFVEGFDPNNTNNLTESKYLFDIANQQSILQNLHNLGYDIIILNFDEGGALIQGNAMVLKALIDTVNEIKQANNELVIIGTSMGGLVARFALAYMENQNEKHHTRLFVSIDTPHQGAYVTLSSQQLIRKLCEIGNFALAFGYNLYTYFDGEVKKISSDAARQMLVYHSFATSNNLANPDDMRGDFMEELNSLTPTGYPQQCRNVALSEGSGNGQTQHNLAPGGLYVDMNEKEVLIENKRVKVTLKMRSLTDNQPVSVFESEFKVYTKLFGGSWASSGPSLYDNITVNNTKPYDSAPGGFYYIMEDLCKSLKEYTGSSFGYTGHECFIPTMSALDIRSSNNLNYNIRQEIMSDTNYIEIQNSSITPFNSIYAEINNKTHITDDGITKGMASYIISQIERGDLFFDDITLSSQTTQYEVINSIITGEEGYSGKNVEICNQSDITFVAGSTIVLNPGFSVEEGSSFNAYIKDFSCSSTPNSISPSFMRNNNIVENERVAKFKDKNSKFEDANNENIISVYPNPSNGIFKISCNLDENSVGKVQIFDLIGHLLYKERINMKEENTINLPLKSGMYFLNIFNSNKQIYRNIIIKK